MTSVCLYLDRSRIFRWHLWLADALSANPKYEVAIRFAPEKRPLPRCCTTLFAIERFIYRIKGDNALDPINQLTERGSGASFDIVVDFATAEILPECGRVLTPCFSFSGVPNEIGAMTSLIDNVLSVEIFDTAMPIPWAARPATTDHTIFTRGVDNLLSCAVGVILKAIHAPPPTFESLVVPSHQNRPMFLETMKRATSTFTRKVINYLEILAKGNNKWSVAWRYNPASLLDGAASFRILPDNGQHFYADPFPYQNHIFVEDFSFATKRGCIAIATIENDNISIPRPIIEENYHLSYPFIFEYDNQIWMIPESGEAHGVYLYRAEKFPYIWKQEGCLIDNIIAHDTTMVFHNNKFWWFVCERVWNSSSWDELSLFSSDKITSQWTAHPRNPIFDSATSRPGGAIFCRNKEIIRPVQDCSQQYGGSLLFCRVDALDSEKFSQTIIGAINCGIYGCHTYNKHDNLEVIDVFGYTRKLQSITASVRREI